MLLSRQCVIGPRKPVKRILRRNDNVALHYTQTSDPTDQESKTRAIFAQFGTETRDLRRRRIRERL